MTNAELIKALRNCSDGFCSLCPYDDYELSTKECEAKLMLDAADALEELQQIADHYEQTAKDYWKEACEYKQRIAELERNFSDVCNANGSLSCERNELLNDVRKLEEQLPKEGEWIDIDGTMFAECSVCGKRHYGCNTPYCDMCGAKMRGEQDEQ